jgi:hypothetical protein
MFLTISCLPGQIVQTGRITQEQRGRAWEHLRAAMERNKTHPFCRKVGPTGNVFAGTPLNLALTRIQVSLMGGQVFLPVEKQADDEKILHRKSNAGIWGKAYEEVLKPRASQK